MTTGNDIVLLASRHIGEKYILGARAPLGNPNYQGPWDCAEFVSWCVFQVSGLKVGMRNDDAYTGFWKTDANTLCTKISFDDAKYTPGAVLLRYPGTTGAIGHNVFSNGEGKTIEAMDKNHGVTSKSIDGRVWDIALLVKGISYTTNPLLRKYKEPQFAFRIKDPLMSDPIIADAKIRLKDFGIDVGNTTPIYDLDMEKAVHNYQLIKGLVVDGIMGKQTLKSLGFQFS